MAENDQLDEVDGGQERFWRKRAAKWVEKSQVAIYTVIVVSLLLMTFLWPRVFISIPPGHSGVLFLYIGGGTQLDHTRGEGLNVIFPWDKVTIYETRLQQQTLTFDVLSKEGLSIKATVSVRFRPIHEMLPYLHKDIGPDYLERLIKPEIQSHVRRTFGSRPAVEIYTSALDVMQEITRIPVLGRLELTHGEDKNPRAYVTLQELRLMNIELPEVVAGAIADKYRQEQLMLEYQYKLEREEREAERKRTEAAGIRDYNSIASNVSPNVLSWRGVEATLELAKSPNAKIIMLGGGAQGGVPILMNLLDGAAGAAGAAPAQPGAAAAPQAAGPAAAAPRPAQPPAPGPAAPPGP